NISNRRSSARSGDTQTRDEPEKQGKRNKGRSVVGNRMLAAAMGLAAALGLTTVSASAFDDALYPDLKGQWRRIPPPGQPAFDPSKPRGWGQEAPLTEEYKKVFEEN